MDGSIQQLVLVVDDDEAMRVALSYLFRSVNLPVKVFSTTDELLGSKLPDLESCLVLDIRLPGVNGLEFQDSLALAGINIPIVFMTGHGDIPMSVRAMRAGAVDFLPKPFREQDMLDAVSRALAQDRRRRAGEKSILRLRALYEGLTPREREIMALVTSGLRNKQIAHQLQISEITVKIHRGHLTKKMEARSLAELVTMAEALGVKR
ncbi:response regulator transcription factor [Bradyrhizobium uaiense]|uniref:Response regulator transcription factor n=1 Tax=Bradyrhizobium uaiense TaxID=2594946 RepID=A0A6P1BCA9_9BRAD|nr:response regulator [Bradyrhizobium uaiense]NEU95241.1 response regulator transcription factor [Bradyrhizobium uaiense]